MSSYNSWCVQSLDSSCKEDGESKRKSDSNPSSIELEKSGILEEMVLFMCRTYVHTSISTRSQENQYKYLLHIGRNHVHLTERFGFVNRHLWLGNFGKSNRGLHARTLFGYVTQTLRLRLPSAN